MAKGRGLLEAGETPVVIELGFPEPLGATPWMGRVWPLARLQWEPGHFNCGQISTEEFGDQTQM